jgi:hypothetical protein
MANKRVGIQSSAQDNFLEPNAVTSLASTAVNGGASGSGSVNLTWSLPAASPPATLYTITSTPATTTQSTTGTSFTFPGLAGGTSYTFTVVASNAAGNSLPATSPAATPTTLPNAPSAPTASSPNANQDVVSWAAPSDLGGTPNTGYTLKSSDGPTYDLGAGVTSTTINETANTAQTYQVFAKNANGNGPYSASSNSVTTTAPYFPPYFPFFPPYFPFFPFFPPYFPPYFPFFPFFPPYFPPYFPYFPFFPPYFPPYFPYFPFFPPFFPPGFGPFFPPGFGPFFPPFFPPGFGPYFKSKFCIEEDSQLLTSNGYILAKDVKVGDVLLTIDPSELNNGDMTSDIVLKDKVTLSETTVVKHELSQKDLIKFNGSETLFSEGQPIFVKEGDLIKYKETGQVQVGDILVTLRVESCEIIFETVDTIEKLPAKDVYDIRCEPSQWFIAGNYIVIS